MVLFLNFDEVVRVREEQGQLQAEDMFEERCLTNELLQRQMLMMNREKKEISIHQQSSERNC